MSDRGIKVVPTDVQTGAIVVQKLTNLVRAGANHDFDALSVMSEIRRKGLPTYISGVVDITRSMYDDIDFVSNGVAQFLANHTNSLPSDVTESLGKNFLRVSGATIKIRDIECDGDGSFGMSLFKRVLPEIFIQKSTQYDDTEIQGGGGNLGESQLLGLLMSLGMPRSNPRIGGIFEQIRSKIIQPHFLDQEDTVKTSPKFDRFTNLYDEYSAQPRKPDMVYLVTDEPPKVQFGVDAAYIKRATEQGKLPRMIFFVRGYIEEWQQVAMELGAEVFDLEKAGDVRVEGNKVLSEVIEKSFSSALLSSINDSLPMLQAPQAA